MMHDQRKQTRRLPARLVRGGTAALLVIGAVQAQAAMRCGSELVVEGDSVVKLLEACGEPVYGDPALYLATAEWTYNFGPNEFMKKVFIDNGRVERIEELGYGFVDAELERDQLTPEL